VAAPVVVSGEEEAKRPLCSVGLQQQLMQERKRAQNKVAAVEAAASGEEADAEGAAGAAVGSWSGSLPALASAPEVDGLSGEQRAELAAQWAADGAAEHASIASFARATLQLMALGAPAGLLADTQRAAADEVRAPCNPPLALPVPCSLFRFVMRGCALRWQLRTPASPWSPANSLSRVRCSWKPRWLAWPLPLLLRAAWRRRCRACSWQRQRPAARTHASAQCSHRSSR
jgi:hypothetical protein